MAPVPASSITGRYQAWTSTDRMWARYRRGSAREAVDLTVLAAVGLDDPHPGDALLEGDSMADPVPDRQVGGVGVALELDAGQDHERQRDEADQQQLPAT